MAAASNNVHRHRCKTYGHYQSNCHGVAKAQEPKRSKQKGKGNGGDPSPKWCSYHKTYSHSDSACYKQKELNQLAAYFASLTTADRARVPDIGSAHIPQAYQPDPPTIGFPFRVMGAALVDSSASSTTSGSSPAELVPTQAASATPTIQLGPVPSEPSPQNHRLWGLWRLHGN